MRYLHSNRSNTLPTTYSFQGQERDDEVKGAGNSYDFGARMYDSRVGRWWSLDALEKKYPNTSAYCFGLNNPIFYTDFKGNDVIPLPSFINSKYYSYYLELKCASPTFSQLLNPYEKKTLNLYFSINEEKVKNKSESNFGITSPKKTINNDSGKETFNLISTSIFYSIDRLTEKIEFTEDDKIYTYTRSASDVKIISAFIHEAIHASIQYENRNKQFSDKDHSIFNKKRDLFIKAFSEYSEANKLGLSSEQIEDISWAGTNKSTQFVAHFKQKANENDTSYDQEVKDWEKRVSNLFHTNSEPELKKE